MKVLIVEDEALLAEEIAVSLGGRQFQCDWASSAAEALNKTDLGHYEFILLDIGLPDKDGFYLLKEIRKDHPETAIIILTARGRVEDRIKGLDMGADDYLSKPFSLLELQSRIMAITRRKYNLNDTLTAVGAFELDIRNRLIRYEDQEVDLSKKEFDLFSYLVLHKNRPLSRLQLSEHLWGDFSDEGNDSNYIDVHIKNIRKKLGAYAPVDWLETIRGIGYKIKME
ncbi:response regulator transcription factor [Niabella yanshanensis]|uniref:Response regulator transcription factor n=1 Tax=Niabella yanshanensis TaxID=577386 RepID=A0ABZ0W070_9BACT|nr:response regulator transcription factor [Niabella yanshanensis]WQD36653.1 response regulator transcription factor [Niabella yanshanensis]